MKTAGGVFIADDATASSRGSDAVPARGCMPRAGGGDAKRSRPLTQAPILYEDEWLVVVDKPANVLSHPNPAGEYQRKRARTAFEGSYDFDRRLFQTPGGPVWLIHRLDQDTSGVLLAAREESTAKECRRLFEKGTIEKTYSVLLLGWPESERGVWRDRIVERRKGSTVRSSIKGGRPPNAELHYTVEQKFSRNVLSLAKIQLITGKTHQIRVQAAYRHCPVAGDEIYGNFSENKRLRKSIGLKRLFLHAHTLTFGHPKTGKRIDLISPLPEELAKCLAQSR